MRQPDHFVRDIHAVDLGEVAAHGTHQAAWSASDFERRVAARQALQFPAERADHIGGGGEELLVVLIVPAERDIVVGVFARALIPIGAHAFEYLGIFHVEAVFFNVAESATTLQLRVATLGPPLRAVQCRTEPRHEEASLATGPRVALRTRQASHTAVALRTCSKNALRRAARTSSRYSRAFSSCGPTFGSSARVRTGLPEFWLPEHPHSRARIMSSAAIVREFRQPVSRCRAAIAPLLPPWREGVLRSGREEGRGRIGPDGRERPRLPEADRQRSRGRADRARRRAVRAPGRCLPSPAIWRVTSKPAVTQRFTARIRMSGALYICASEATVTSRNWRGRSDIGR